MSESEVIIVDSIPEDVYFSLIEKCVRYAVVSLPFTVDRMKIGDETQRIRNIAKGKIAEMLFQCFCNANNIPLDFAACATEFWKVDKRDFLLNGDEWDVKNNFIYTPGELLNGDYVNLPALVPNRFYGDQWSKRTKNLLAGTNGICFLFTFLKNATINKGIRGDEFLEIYLTSEQKKFLSNLYSTYKGASMNARPYHESWFWEMMGQIELSKIYRLNFRPHLIITGYADKNIWENFRDTGPSDTHNHWQHHLETPWYYKTPKGSCNFMHGTLWTTITNATLPVSALQSFSGLFPHLQKGMHYGRLKQ